VNLLRTVICGMETEAICRWHPLDVRSFSNEKGRKHERVA
jgi:hypothetical protein